METKYKPSRRDIILFTAVMLFAMFGEGIFELMFGK